MSNVISCTQQPYQSFAARLLAHWESLAAQCAAIPVPLQEIDGHQLDLATVLAVARYGAQVQLSREAETAINVSAGILKESLSKGLVIYGVNTGFGGSADTQLPAVKEIQDTLIRELHYGILTGHTEATSRMCSSQDQGVGQDAFTRSLSTALPLDNPDSATCMPEAWSRASMVIRLNSLASGASGVRLETTQNLAALLNKNIVPRIPLRGSISASGDLSPLAYIGGAMQGTPTIMVWADDKERAGERKLMRADRALAEAGIAPISLGPKEGLAIVNGTAISVGVASLALHEAHCQAALCQVLTAMSVEALHGTDESFDPYFAQVRPHPGQIDSASAILSFLSGSSLIHRSGRLEDMTLRQDRYSIRTASQWIGPVLEDLLLAHQQIVIELNSVTDNPLVNSQTGRVLHGGNFQAKSVTSAMEKVRAGLQTIGRMLFTQCTELINPATNRGLPPNLVVDEPTTSFIWKGTDLMAAALVSELGFLASPVSPHVQTAEMGNQSLNSLALISARYTLTAVEVLTQLSAAFLVALCQALDLRAMQRKFSESFKPEFEASVREAYGVAFSGGETPTAEAIFVKSAELWMAFERRLNLTMTMNVAPRFEAAVKSLQPLLLQDWPASANSVTSLRDFTEACANKAIVSFERTKTEYRKRPDATPLLGRGSKRLYTYVREKLQVPFFGKEEITVPEGSDSSIDPDREWPTVGGFNTRTYESMRTGELYAEVMQCFKEIDGQPPPMVQAILVEDGDKIHETGCVL